MIRLKPEVDLGLKCPVGHGRLRVIRPMITGMHSMVELTCSPCNKTYYAEMPVNAGLFYPGMIDGTTGERCDDMPFDNWYLSGLVSAFRERRPERLPLEVLRNWDLGEKPVLLLNTIDATYGHALFELFNASYYLKKRSEFDLVIIAQRSMKWLLPDGAAQLWIVDLPFSSAANWYDGLATQVEEQLTDVRDVFICRSFVQADSQDFDIEAYTRVKPFPLGEWNKRLAKPTVTFIWRHDRFWRRVLSRWIDNRVTRRIAPALLRWVRKRLQFNWLLQFADELKRHVPGVDFAIAGMDDRDPVLPSWIKDYRYPDHRDDTAGEQLVRYAQSHLIVGCNGSSLLLPGCLSGSVVDVVPGDQWAVSAGSFSFRVTSPGDTHFRYALVPAEVTIARLVNIVVSILRDRAYVEIQTSPPWRDHDARLGPFDWAGYRREAFELHRYFGTVAGLVTAPKKKK
jgi:hypothetical protein